MSHDTASKAKAASLPPGSDADLPVVERPPAPVSDETAPAEPARIDPSKTHEIAEFKHERPLTTCRVDPSGRFVFAGAEDFHIYRWEIASGRMTVLRGHESWVRCLAFSPGGDRLYSAGWDGQIRWWATDADEPEPLRVVQAHQGFARWVSASPCGKMLATCGNDKRVRVWDEQSGSQIIEMTGHARHPYAVLFHPTAGQLVSEDLLGEILVWDPHQARQVAVIDASIMTGYDNKFAADMGGARDMTFSASGSTLACAGITNVVNSFAGKQDPIVVLIDWSSKTITHHLRTEDNTTGIMWGVRFHPAGFIVGAVARQNGRGELLFWRIEEAARSEEADQDGKTDEESSSDNTQPVDVKPFHTLPLAKCARGMDFTADSRRIAVAHSDGTLRLYEMAPPAETTPAVKGTESTPS